MNTGPGNGNDEVFGGFGRDVLNGGGGDDAVFGTAGSDVLNGGSGDDFLDGDFPDADNPFGSPIDPNPNFDTCNGGSGDDSSFACEANNSVENILTTLPG
ncbi:MAG: calcium-binding protein [Gaiellaceae bacterium]